MSNREQRAAIAQDTLSVLERGSYQNWQGQNVSIADALAYAVQNSIHYRAETLREIAVRPVDAASRTTRFQVANESTLAGARRLIEQGFDDVLCLNFASARNPGGGFLGGSEAQEESLAKSSGLYPCIEQMMDMYTANREMTSCVYKDDMIYSPKVPVFRDDAYQYLDAPYLLSMVTAPAVNRGAIARNEPQRLPELGDIMLKRIELLLALAKYHGHRALVLGAWGCGVFGNDPKEMASWFAQHLLHNPAFQNAFDVVSFAVLDRRNDGSHAAFAECYAG